MGTPRRAVSQRVLWSLGNGEVRDMAAGKATTAQGPPPPPHGHRFVSFALLIVCGGTFGLIFSANKIAVTGGIPFFAYVFWQTVARASSCCCLPLCSAGARA